MGRKKFVAEVGSDLSDVCLCDFDVSSCNFDDCVFDNNPGENSTALCEFNLDFSYSSMRRVSIRNNYLVGTDFSYVNLEQANFTDSAFQGVDFSNANLTNARMVNTDWCSRDDGMTWSQTFAVDAAMVGIDLTNSDLAGACLRGADMRNAVLVNVDFSGADLTDANLIDANLTGANLDGAILTGTKLS